MVTGENFNGPSSSSKSDLMDNILDIREYDVPYYVRLSIDTKINVVSTTIHLLETMQFVIQALFSPLRITFWQCDLLIFVIHKICIKFHVIW